MQFKSHFIRLLAELHPTHHSHRPHGCSHDRLTKFILNSRWEKIVTSLISFVNKSMCVASLNSTVNIYLCNDELQDELNEDDEHNYVCKWSKKCCVMMEYPPAKFFTICLMLSSVRRGTVAKDHDGSSAIILLMFRQSAAGLSRALRSGISGSSWPIWVNIAIMLVLLCKIWFLNKLIIIVVTTSSRRL